MTFGPDGLTPSEPAAPRQGGPEDIEHRFTYHPPNEAKKLIHEGVRNEFAALAQTMNSVLPDGREKSLVLTKLEEAMFWANAAIARQR